MKKITYLLFLILCLNMRIRAEVAPVESKACLDKPEIPQEIPIPEKKVKTKKIPSIQVTTLTEEKVSFPEQCKNCITIALFGFDAEAKTKILSWSAPLHEKYKNHAQVRVRQFAMIGPVNAFTRWMYDSGMKSNVQKKFHHTVYSYYGELDEWKKFLGATIPDECYVLLLDQEGHVHAEYRGKATDEAFKQLDSFINELTNPIK